MAADVELLPLPEPWQCETGMCPKLYSDEQVSAYAHACVAHATAAKDAEIDALRAENARLRVAKDADRIRNRAAEGTIEALRAEVERLEDESQSRLEACGDAVSKLCAAEARAERLAEALQKIADYDPVGGDEWLSAVDLLQRWAKQALHPTAAQEKDDA